MATFGAKVTAAVWPVLKAQGGLTSITMTVIETSIDHTTGEVTQTFAVATPDALVGPFARQEVDGVRVTSADRRVLVRKADVTLTPTVNMSLTIAGVVWDVIGVSSVSNDGLWELHVRQLGQV